MNKITKQHNDLIDLPLKKFNASEIDILTAVCYKCQDKGCNEIELSFDDLRELTHYKNKNDEQFIESILETNRKLMTLNFELSDEDKVVQFVLFPLFETNRKKNKLIVKVNEAFAYLLNDFGKNYTSMELQESTQLKSGYSKQLYKKLRKYRGTGWWQCSLEEFREYLDIPQSFQIGMIDKRVIKLAIDELSPYFKGLRCDKVRKKNSSGRGRPAVVGFKFTFQKEEPKEKIENMDKLAARLGYEKIGKYCPVCNREVYQKSLKNENGAYYLIGHPDFKTGGCNWTTTNFDEALSSQDLENLKVPTPSENEMKKREKNKTKFNEIVKNLFKFK